MKFENSNLTSYNAVNGYIESIELDICHTLIGVYIVC